MSPPPEDLADTTRQMLAAESLLGGGDFLPAGQNPLPPLTVSSLPAAASPERQPHMPADSKADALREIDENEVRNCTKCPLSSGRTHTVFGEGSATAELVFVGEGPGRDEDLSGRPFVGRAGELLAKMITAMGLTRQDVFICNIVKCRPPGNRAPATEEISACWDYLVRQLQIIRPKVIVTLGNPATQNLLNTRVGITRLRGQWQSLGELGEGLAGIDVMPTFHPAYILRQYTVDNRRKAWSDLQAVMQRLKNDG